MTIMVGSICKLEGENPNYNSTCFVSWNKKTLKITVLNEKKGFIEEINADEDQLTPIAGFQSEVLPPELILPHQLVLKNPKKKKNVKVRFQNPNGIYEDGIIVSKANGLLTIDANSGTYKVHMNLVDLV